MCRLAAYIGPPLQLQRFLLEPRHSLYRQSWEPKEMFEAVVNADGFGVGWHQQQLECYLSARPIWNDVNLQALARCLQSDTWAACVRSATPGQAVHELNSQPFVAGDWLFLHNGFIRDFDSHGREAMLRLLPAAAVAAMRGSSDSAFIAALLQQHLAAGLDPAQALAQLAAQIGDHVNSSASLLSIIICRPGMIYALRHAIAMQCPSLYTCHDGKAFPGAHLCASEAFDDDNWQPVPEHTVVGCVANRPPQYLPLQDATC